MSSDFVVISKKEFEDFLQEFSIVDNQLSKEIIYDVPTKDPRINIRLYSSIDIRTQDSRNIGEDAIRCVLIDVKSEKAIDKGKRTHRMSNWKERLQEKIIQLKSEVDNLKFCKSCGSVMQLRETKTGAFWGCVRYPICMCTLSIDGKYREKQQSNDSQIVHCPLCDSLMTKRNGKRGEFYGCSSFFKTGCKGTRQVNEVEIYGQGKNDSIKTENETKENLSSEFKFSEPVQQKPIDIPTDDSDIELIPTSKFPHIKFKYEFFNPVQSRVFQYYDQDINLIVAAATSAGKTTIAEMLMSDSIFKGKKAAFLSPLKAVSQEKYDDWTHENHTWGNMNVSIVTGDYALTEKRVEELNKANVIVMTNEMLDSHTRRIKTEKNDWLLDVGIAVMDECFTRGILIKIEENINVPIKDIYENKKITHILSYNEEEKILEKKKILRRIKKSFSGSILSIKYKINGKICNLTCTPNHKIWTEKGYKRADELIKGDILKIFPLNENKTCFTCNNEFRTRTIFLKHYLKEHFRQEYFICEKCEKEFYRKGDFTHHTNFNHNIKHIFKCENCKRQYKNKKSLLLHINKHHKNSNFKCKFCPATFSNKNAIKSHIWHEHNMFKNRKNKKEILEYNRDNETHELWTESKNLKKSSFEKKIIEINNENIIFTGNHSFWLTLGKFKNGKLWRKNPDFKIKDQRKVIEVGDITYWHTLEEIKQVIKGYKSIKYECLYLTNKDFEEKNWKKTIEKINTFINNHKGIVLFTKKWGSKQTKNTYVYNLEVEDNHNYIANNVLVSNCHLITMNGRGDKCESAMMRFSKQNPSCRIVFLSATMPNVSELARWLTLLNGKKTELINSDYRPCKLTKHYERYNDQGRYADVENRKIQGAIKITQEFPADKFIIFVHAKATGKKIEFQLKNMGEEVLFNSADLALKERLEITKSFKQKEGGLRIIVATSVLAWGVNLPARRVIIVGVHRGLTEVEPLDIKQEAGRAGRVGFDPEGDAYILLPDSKFNRYKQWCENIPPIKSTLNDIGVLAFHVVSEICEGEVYNIQTLMSWYNRSLAAFQEDMLDRIEAQSLLDSLEKYKIIEKQGESYKVTSLGRVAAHLYLDPYTIAGWYLNFNKIFNEGIEDDVSISWALANIRLNNDKYIPKNFVEQVTSYKYRLNKNGLVLDKGPAWVGYIFECCLTYSDAMGEERKKDVKFDFERTVTALERIDQQCAHWNKGDFWQKLLLRIQYEVSWEQTELCSLKGIGTVIVRKLFSNDITTLRQFKNSYKEASRIIGISRYNKIVVNNKLDIPQLEEKEQKSFKEMEVDMK